MSAITAEIGAQYRTAVLKAAIAAIEVAKEAGDISDHGYGEPIPGTMGEYRTGMHVSKQHFNIAEVATSLLYLAAGPLVILPTVPRETKRSGTLSSYYLKHQAEDWGELVGFAPYVSNGAFIVAADWMGVPSRRHRNSPNIGYGVKLTNCFSYSDTTTFDTSTESARYSRYLQARALCKVVAPS